MNEHELNRLKEDIASMDLDKAVDEQAALVYYWGEKAVEAAEKRDALEAAMEEVAAKIDIELRKKFANEKFTEKQLSSRILLDKRYKAARAAFLRAKRESKRLEIIIRALDHKKSMLKIKHERMLSNLHPDTSRDLLRDRVSPEVMKRIEAENIREALRRVVKPIRKEVMKKELRELE